MAELRERTGRDTARAAALEQELAKVDAELSRLADALAGGADLAAVLTAIRTREARRAEITRALTQAAPGAVEQLPDARKIRRELETRIGEWRTLLRQHVETGQQLLRRLIEGRLVVTPEEDADGRYYRFEGQGSWWRFASGARTDLAPIAAAMRPHQMASPTGFEPVFWP